MAIIHSSITEVHCSCCVIVGVVDDDVVVVDVIVVVIVVFVVVDDEVRGVCMQGLYQQFMKNVCSHSQASRRQSFRTSRV